jgi:hypothetical protein
MPTNNNSITIKIDGDGSFDSELELTIYGLPDDVAQALNDALVKIGKMS